MRDRRGHTSTRVALASPASQPAEGLRAAAVTDLATGRRAESRRAMWPASPQDKDGLRARCIRTRAVARTATATLDRADSAISRQAGTAAESANKARYGPCGRAARASTRRSSRYRAPPSDHGHRAPARWWQTRLTPGRHIT